MPCASPAEHRAQASGAQGELLDDRGKLNGRVALQAMARFLDMNDLGGRQSTQQFLLVVVVQHRIRPHASGEQHWHGDRRQHLPERRVADTSGWRGAGLGRGTVTCPPPHPGTVGLLFGIVQDAPPKRGPGPGRVEPGRSLQQLIQAGEAARSADKVGDVLSPLRLYTPGSTSTRMILRTNSGASA
jgi:hypothetical protein